MRVKRPTKCVLTLLLAVLLAAWLPAFASAAQDEDEIYYNSVKTTVQVHENGTADVTMQVDAVLPKQDAPTLLHFYGSNSINTYAVENFDITGTATCSVTRDDAPEVLLGAAGETGPHQFTITYRMRFYDDLNDTCDWAEFDFWLNRLEGAVQAFTAQVTLPETAAVQSWKLLEYDERAYDGPVTVEQEGNVLRLQGENLRRYDALSLYVQCDKGLFTEVQSYPAECVVRSRASTITVDSEMLYTVSERLTVEVPDGKDYIGLPVVDFEDYDIKFEMQAVSCNLGLESRESSYDNSVRFYLMTDGVGDTYEVEYVYTVRPARMDAPFALDLEQGASIDRTDAMTLTFRAPGLRNARAALQGNKLAHVPINSRVTAEPLGESVTVTLNTPMYGYESLVLEAERDDALYSRPIEQAQWLALLGALLCLAVCILCKIFRGTPPRVLPAPQVGPPAPPRGVNSAEAGYLKDGVISVAELSTLVLQWAAQGAVRVEESRGEYILTLVREPLDAPNYERLLLRQMFACGGGGHVTTVQMRGRLAGPMNMAQQAVAGRYRGEHALQTGSAGKWACMALAAVPMLLLGAMGAIAEDWGVILGVSMGLGCMVVQFLVSCLWLPLCGNRSGALTPAKSKEPSVRGLLMILSLVACAAGYILLLCSLFPSTALALIAVTELICLMAACAGALFLRRRPMAQTLLSEVSGFYDALRYITPDTMRQAQRETRGWCGAMLPYAMVFGQTVNWQNVAREAKLPPPEGIVGVEDFAQYVTHAQRLTDVLGQCAWKHPLR